MRPLRNPHIRRGTMLIAGLFAAALVLPAGAGHASTGSEGASPMNSPGDATVDCTIQSGTVSAAGSGVIDDAINQEFTIQIRAYISHPTGEELVVLTESSSTEPNFQGRYEAHAAYNHSTTYYNWHVYGFITGERQGNQEYYDHTDYC